MSISVTSAILAATGVTGAILAALVLWQHRTINSQHRTIDDLTGDVATWTTRCNRMWGEIQTLRAFLPPRRPGGPVSSGGPVQLQPGERPLRQGEQPTQVMQVPQPPNPRYDRSAT